MRSRALTANVLLAISTAAHPAPSRAAVVFEDEAARRDFAAYVAVLERDPAKYATELATVRQLERSEVEYRVRVGGPLPDGADGALTTDGERVYVDVPSDGDRAKFFSRFSERACLAHELEHARQFDDGEFVFARDPASGRWGPATPSFDIGDEVKAWSAQLRLSVGRDFWRRPRGTPAPRPSLLAKFAAAKSDGERARVLIENGYGHLTPAAGSATVSPVPGRRLGDLVRPCERPNLFFRMPAVAQEHDHHHHEAELGSVHFANSCRPEVQADLQRGVALLHSFGYEPARAAFAAVLEKDPRCAVAWWGIAMSYYHPIWAPPTRSDLEQGRAAAEKAAALAPASDRERAYVAAIGTFYKDADKVDHTTRAAAYRDAMADLARRFPDDHEAAIFYALALLGAAPPSDPTFAQQKQAAEILNRLLPLEPDHPGIAHYLIHAFDYPQLASLALPAARVYARIAPASAHAQHMPSHIFTRLGLWEESIRSNLDSERTADELVARAHPGAAAFDALHALDYLEYAYLQTGQDARAKEVMDRAYQATIFDEANFAAGYALAAIRARYTLERRQWAEAAGLEPPKARLPWESFPYALAVTHFARAIGGARGGRPAVAEEALTKLAAIRDGLAESPPAGPYDWAGEVESLRLAAAGWLARARGKNDDAVQLLGAAADLQDRVGKHPVTPGEVLPARELLGDLLLELGRPADALAAYEAALRAAPNRFNGLYGAARAAELAGDATKAHAFYTQITGQCAAADGARPELRKARAAISR